MTAGLSLLTTWGDRTGWGQGSFVFDSCLCDWLQIQKPWTWTFSKAFGHILTHRKYVIPPKLQAFNYRKASLFPSSIMDLQSGRLCLCCFPRAYLLCMLYFCPAPLTITLWGLWIWSQRAGIHRCHSAQSSDSTAFFCTLVLLFSFSSSVKLLVLGTGSLSLSTKPFLFYKFPKELPLSSLHGKEVNIPRFPHCCPHFHSMFSLLLGDAKREMSCTHLFQGPEGLRLCTRLDVMCVKLLFSEYRSPSWTPASCATVLTRQCTDRSSKSYMWQRK